jgi:hypothetical protein
MAFGMAEMSKRFIDWNGDPNSPAYWWHEDGEGNWAQEVVQNVDEILKMNAFLRTGGLGPQDKEVQMTHQIPVIMASIWRKEYGIDIYQMNDADQQAWLEKNILNSSDTWFRPSDVCVAPSMSTTCADLASARYTAIARFADISRSSLEL